MRTSAKDDHLGVGVLGAGWITRAHCHALHTLGHLAPLRRPPRLVALAARRPDQAESVARELGFDRFTTEWRDVVEDPDVDVVANLMGFRAHQDATEAALQLGKPVLCEKPLAPDRAAAGSMLATAQRTNVTAVCGFNYRYVPAMRLAYDVIRSGALGQLVQFRAVYLQDYASVPNRLLPANDSRAVTDYAHIVDFLRYLGGEVEAVAATTATFTTERREDEDAYVAAVDLRGGGIASLEASRVARGWKGRQVVEFNGTAGSLWWNMEDLNRLHVFTDDAGSGALEGFRDVFVTEPDHPYLEQWWQPGHAIGWQESFVHQWRDFLSAVIDQQPLQPHQASFADGYEAALICDAILLSSAQGRRVAIDELRSAPELAAGG